MLRQQVRYLRTMASSSASAKHYNALILGSGQAGTPLASHIASLGKTVCLVESTHISGCCVNEGCTPTKTMVASGRIAYLARRAAEYGVSSTGGGSGDVKIDMQKIRQRKRDIVNSFRGGSEKRLENSSVDVIMGHAKFVEEKEVEVSNIKDEKDARRLTADQVFINVGCRPSKPDVPGVDQIEQSRVLDSTSIQELGEVPKHLVVLGGGVIGLEFGQLFRRLGAKVTIIQRGPRLLARREDPELAECMQKILQEDGIELLFEATVSKISKSEDSSTPIVVTTSSKGSTGSKDLSASHILVATGRTPNTDTLNLPEGIKTTKSGYIAVSPSLETSVEGVYALGDVKGPPAFTHVSYDDFRIVRDSLFNTSSDSPSKAHTIATREHLIPSVTYTDPQFASIGTPLSALPKDKKFITYSMPGSWIARGLETEETRGMLKAVVDAETNKIVHFAAISTEGGEIMSVVQMAMMGGLTWMDLRDSIFAHPSWAEALNNLWGGEKKEVNGGAS